MNRREDTRGDTRRERFAIALAAGNSGKEAARLAGYSAKSDGSLRTTASRLMSNANILSRARALLHDSLEQQGCTPEWTAGRLKQMIEQSMTGGKPQLMAAVKALELMARLQGLIVDHDQVDLTVHSEFAGLSELEKAKLLADKVRMLYDAMLVPAALSSPDAAVQ